MTTTPTTDGPTTTDSATAADLATIDAAMGAAERGELAGWLHDFLSSPGSDNAALAEELAERGLHWARPTQLPFDELHRLAGPPDQPTIGRLDDDDGSTVAGMVDSITDDGWEPPPAIVTYRPDRDQYVVEDGNHRIEGLRQAGHDRWWAVVGFLDDEARDRFENGSDA